MTESGFYRAFEDQHRGSRELISSRLQVYLPFVEPLRESYGECATVDVGCGRGEWLELLQQHGFKAFGVDLDEGMLAACAERGLPSANREATAYLKSLADASQCVVSGFHIAEHLSFRDLGVVVEEALRVLKPGGLLILETPNPENIVVGTTNFYLDPTHQRPLPPLLLEFLAEYHGFARVKTLRLQEAPELATKVNVGLRDVMEGASPDYAIVAQKGAGPEVLRAFDAVFGASYGIDLTSLANRYDATVERRFASLASQVASVEAYAGRMESVLERMAALHESLLSETVRAERSETRSAALEEELRLATGRLEAMEQEVRRDVAMRDATIEEKRLVQEAQQVSIRAAEAALAAAREHASEMERAYERQRLETAQWWRATDQLTNELQLVYGTLSWRITAPLRWVR
jgi:O-antigen chain-terminating methyltransferase